MSAPYWELVGFESVYLEDSWVTGINATQGVVAFQMDLVLRENHPEYVLPPPNEQYCYRRGTIQFVGVSDLYWSMNGYSATDASGEIDFGNIDSLSRDGEGYKLEGDWGQMRLHAQGVQLSIADLPIG